MESKEWFWYNYTIIHLTYAMHYNFIWLQKVILQFAYIWYSVKIELCQSLLYLCLHPEARNPVFFKQFSQKIAMKFGGIWNLGKISAVVNCYI